MKLIDLSREIHHKMARLPNHPSIVFEVHLVCRDMGFTHIEGLANLDRLVGAGRFRFIGFPPKIRGGTGSPIRAVAWLDD